MTTWTELFSAAASWLTQIWDGIFGIVIFDGVSFKMLLIFILVAALSISIVRYLLSNTHSENGIYADSNGQPSSIYRSRGRR